MGYFLIFHYTNGKLIAETMKWNDGPEGRKGLEGMLMKHTIEYAKTGMKCYEKARSGDHISCDFLDTITGVFGDPDLVSIYSALGNIR